MALDEAIWLSAAMAEEEEIDAGVEDDEDEAAWEACGFPLGPGCWGGIALSHGTGILTCRETDSAVLLGNTKHSSNRPLFPGLWSPGGDSGERETAARPRQCQFETTRWAK